MSMFSQLSAAPSAKSPERKPWRADHGQKKMFVVLAFMREFFEENDTLPPCHIVAAHFGFASNNAAHVHMKALEKHGFIEPNVLGKWRFVRVHPSKDMQ